MRWRNACTMYTDDTQNKPCNKRTDKAGTLTHVYFVTMRDVAVQYNTLLPKQHENQLYVANPNLALKRLVYTTSLARVVYTT